MDGNTVYECIYKANKRLRKGRYFTELDGQRGTADACNSREREVGRQRYETLSTKGEEETTRKKERSQVRHLNGLLFK